MNTVTHFAWSARFVLLFFVAILLPVPVAAQPVLSVSPTSVGVQANVGTNATSQTVQVRNAGNRALKWSVVPPSGGWPAWLSVSPTSGVNSGTLTLTFSTSTLVAGQYTKTFSVQAQAGTPGSPALITVTVDMVTPPAPPPLTVTCPANISVASPDGSSVPVTYSATASGGSGPVTITGVPASGSSFAVGTTPVQVTATSGDGQTASCGFTVTVTYSPPPPPPPSSGVGPQSTITCPAGAVDIWPGSSVPYIQSLVDGSAGTTTFCFRAGIHYVLGSIVPKTGNTFVGEYGAILDGTGWMTTNDTDAAFRAYEQDIDSVTIRNLVIRNLRRGIHAGYPYVTPGPDHWTIEYNEIGPNYSGFEFPSDSTIRNNYIHHNSNRGFIGVYADNSLLENNEIAYNGWESKVGISANVTFRNNFVHHNEGVGIWYDSDNTGALVEWNRVEDNGWIGIFYEISGDGIIRNNTIRRNGDAGVFLGTSKNTQIYNNTIDNNLRGITYFFNCASVGNGTIYYDLTNNTSHDNSITVGTESGAWATNFDYWSTCTEAEVAPYKNGLKNLTFSNNTYDVPFPATGQYWYWDGFNTWSQWQALGFDTTGTVK